MTVWDSASGGTVVVATTQIDPVLYPSLESYLDAGFKPTPAKGSKGWRILSSDRVRTDETIPAQRFIYQYLDAGILKTGEEHWYVLSHNLVSVAGVTDRNFWPNLKVWDEIREMQESFDPSRYASASNGYSLAYPTFWIEESSISYDYWVADPASTRNLYVQVFPAKNYASVEDYGNDNTVFGVGIVSRRQVYSKRAIPSYRMDYIRPASNEKSRQRGSVLITLGGGNAVWVFVEADAGDWSALQPTLDQIFLRVAVRP